MPHTTILLSLFRVQKSSNDAYILAALLCEFNWSMQAKVARYYA
ncbi:MAG: hypothetical protein ACJA2G_003446, partial [Cognaticolwellia sp.]